MIPHRVTLTVGAGLAVVLTSAVIAAHSQATGGQYSGAVTLPAGSWKPSPAGGCQAGDLIHDPVTANEPIQLLSRGGSTVGHSRLGRGAVIAGGCRFPYITQVTAAPCVQVYRDTIASTRRETLPGCV